MLLSTTECDVMTSVVESRRRASVSRVSQRKQREAGQGSRSSQLPVFFALLLFFFFFFLTAVTGADGFVCWLVGWLLNVPVTC